MKLKAFKEKDKKKIGIILFTIICILLISGVILYRTFAIFETNDIFNVINGTIEDEGNIRFMVYVDNELQKSVPTKESGYSLDTSTSYCENGEVVSWNDERWSVEIKGVSTTKTKCYLYFKEIYKESILNGAIPDLGNELVAVTFDETGHAKKASLTSEWYSYAYQRWANAVILRTKQNYAVGETIPEENIESYFVWIPRYEYQIWNGEEKTNQFTNVKGNLGKIEDATTRSELNQQQSINIKFVNKNDVIKTGSTTESWLTHPAFTSFDSNGFWVGKFETGYNQDEIGESNITSDDWNVAGAEKNVIASDRVIIKPNIYSWRNIQIANAFYTTYNYKRKLDSHMMKNMEWGAVAYLTNSKYGRCNGTCTEVRINNNSNYITGSSAVKEPTCGYIDSNTGTNISCNQYGTDTSIVNDYNNPSSVASSTTNNYYGIYDMAGGAFEYVMGVMLDQKGKPASGRNNTYNSNFIGTLTYPYDGSDTSKTQWNKEDGGMEWPVSKYYDIYDYDITTQNYDRGHFGDGTKEFGPFYQGTYASNSCSICTRQLGSWHADDLYFIDDGDPWFDRSGDFSLGSGIGLGTALAGHGSNMQLFSFRIILTP